MKQMIKQVTMLMLILSFIFNQFPVKAAESDTEGKNLYRADSSTINMPEAGEKFNRKTKGKIEKKHKNIDKADQVFEEEIGLKALEASEIADKCLELPKKEWGNEKVRAVTTLSASQIADYANSRVGTAYASGYCMRFVADVFQNLGAARSSTCCAYNYGNGHITSTDINSIPVGADVFFGNCGGGPCSSCGSYCYGHIGIYVGDGYFVHATGGKVQKTYLPGNSYWKSRFRGWGYHGNVSVNQNQADTCNCSDEYAGYYTCTSRTSLNIRSGHGTSYGSIGNIPSGATVYVSKSDGTWAHVDYNGISGLAAMQYLEKQNPSVSVSLHAWISDTAMGGVPDTFYQGERYYLCYELLDNSTGKRISADHGGLNYSVKEEIIRSDGSSWSYEYDNSDNNWISMEMDQSGTYQGIVTVRGDIGITVELSWDAKARISTVRVSNWLSEDQMGDTPSEYVQGKWYYSCYELTDKDSGMLVNGFSSYDYTLTEEVYNPDGSLEYSYTYNNADTNWIGFRAKYAGTYTLKYILKGNIGGAEFDGTVTAKKEVKANPTQITSKNANVNLVIGGIESITTDVVMSGYYNGTRQYHYESSNSNVKCSWGTPNGSVCPLTIQAVSPGTATITLQARDASTLRVLASSTINVTISANKYRISYNANGGSGAPASQNKTHGSSINLSEVVPKRFGYNFVGWSKSSSAISATYMPGTAYTGNSDLTLYAVWSQAQTISTSLPVTKSVNVNIGGAGEYFKFKPSISGLYKFESMGTLDTYIVLYDINGNQLGSNDDGGESWNFLLTHNLSAGTTYYIETRMYGSNATGKFNMLVSRESLLEITEQPKTQQIVLNKNAVFSVKASGEGLNYQWQFSKDGGKSWTNSGMTGNQTSSLSVQATASRNGQMYRCVVKDKTGQKVTSTAATLNLKLAITEQPKNQQAVLNKNAVFSVKASGEGLSYQWQFSKDGGKSWTNSGMTGNQTSSLSVQATASRNGQMYRCVVKDKTGQKVTSTAATLNLKLAITEQPKNQQAVLNKNVVFSVKASGEGLSYQWQFSKDGGKSWTNSGMTGNQTSSLSVQATASRNGQMYRCVVKDKTGQKVTSTAAILNLKLAITEQPKNQQAVLNKNVVFSVKASGEGLSYQWQFSKDGGKSWTNSGMTGNQTSSLSVQATASRNGQRYRCVVKDKTGQKVTSTAATLNLKLTIMEQPKNQQAVLNKNVVFSVKASGEGLSYQWQFSKDGGKSWTNSGMTGNQTSSLSVQATASRNGQRYRCVVKDKTGQKVTSTAATLNLKLAITEQPKNQQTVLNKNVVFSVKASGEGLSYQWQFSKDGGKSWTNSGMTGNQTSSLSVQATASRNGQRYRCVVKDKTGQKVTSTAAILKLK